MQKYLSEPKIETITLPIKYQNKAACTRDLVLSCDLVYKSNGIWVSLSPLLAGCSATTLTNVTLNLVRNNVFKFQVSIQLSYGQEMMRTVATFTLWVHDDCSSKVSLKPIANQIAKLWNGNVDVTVWQDFYDHHANPNCEPLSCFSRQNFFNNDQTSD